MIFLSVQLAQGKSLHCSYGELPSEQALRPMLRDAFEAAIIGGVAGHMAGHDAVGAASGCVIGHDETNKRQNATRIVNRRLGRCFRDKSRHVVIVRLADRQTLRAPSRQRTFKFASDPGTRLDL